MDTGIREATILGQGIGLAQRGFRPIVDIQYVDYMPYCLQLATDELATLHHRTAGGQSAPVIIRTKGHRLQGMWHAGSPMAVLLHSLRGIYVAVPRDMTQAAGMYNLLLRGDNPAIVIEVLNGYRQKERMPANVGEFRVALGRCQRLRKGTDVTIVTYGACCRIVEAAAQRLVSLGISAEVIDVQTLNPFDLDGMCAQSNRGTHALLVVDEDVPGGASAFLLQQILERDGAFDGLDVPPRTLTAAEYRTPFGQDGDYFTKPGIHDVVRAAYGLMRERWPARFPPID
jgi:pyruvate/2-oxoglutarate/acetoin dehydrogenase E1 component